MFSGQARLRLQPRHHLSSCDSRIMVSHMVSRNRPIKKSSVVDHEHFCPGSGRSCRSRYCVGGVPWRKRSRHPKKVQACGSGRPRSRNDGRKTAKNPVTYHKIESRAVLSTLCRSETCRHANCPWPMWTQRKRCPTHFLLIKLAQKV